MALCNTSALNAWGIIREERRKIDLFTKVIQGPKETFMDFLHRLISAVNRMIPTSETIQVIIESLATDQYKIVIRPLKARSTSLE